MAESDDLRAIRESVEAGLAGVRTELRGVAESSNTTLTDMRVVTAEALAEVKGGIDRVEQKVDLRHEETQAHGDRILEAERDIDKLERGHAQTKVIGGLLGGGAGLLLAFLKDAFGAGKG